MISMQTEVLETVVSKVKDITAIDTTRCYYYGKDCSSRCDGYRNCWDFESIAEVMHRRKIDKTYKLV